MDHVLVAGISTRAIAESAGRAGFEVTALDAFGDLDQHAAVQVETLDDKFTARAAALATRRIDCDAVAYLSNFENHPRAIETLARGRALWGNTPQTVRRVRDPLLLAETLRKRGFKTPEVRLEPDTTPVIEPDTTPVIEPGARPVIEPGATESYVVSGFSRTTGGDLRDWLVKPLASGGGQHIKDWDGTWPLPRGTYLQEFIDGTPGSIVFVAAAGRVVPLGISLQLIGQPAFGAEGYQYCGNILTGAGDPHLPHDEALVDTAKALASAVADAFGLVGVNGIDFVVHDGVPYPIEVNPRWCASMELVERAYHLSVFRVHASACSEGILPDFDLVRARQRGRTVGKAVVYARREVTVGDTRTWLTKHESIRDIPRPDTRIPSGKPVCTIFAEGPDGSTCHDALIQRAHTVYAQLEAWSAQPRT